MVVPVSQHLGINMKITVMTEMMVVGQSQGYCTKCTFLCVEMMVMTMRKIGYEGEVLTSWSGTIV